MTRERLRYYWAKSGSGMENCHALLCHSLDVAAVAERLLTLHPALRDRLVKCLGIDAPLLQSAFRGAAVLHDIGKVAPGFVKAVPESYARVYPWSNGTALANRGPHHTVVSRYLLDEWALLGGSSGDVRPSNWWRTWIAIAAGHHGRPVQSHDLHAEMTNGPAGKAPRDDGLALPCILLDLIQSMDVLGTELSVMHHRRLGRLSHQLAGLLTLCDWIGSDGRYFPPTGLPAPDDLRAYWQKALEKADAAIVATGVLPAKPAALTSFARLFPERQAPRPMQRVLDDVKPVAGAQLWLLEDLTGSGKTEAAFLLAHKIIAAGLADGMFVGLPTMATSNAMHKRLTDSEQAVTPLWRRFFADEEPASLVLAHSAREVHGFMAVRGGATDDESGTETEVDSETCSAWLSDSNRKSLWAHVGVGTIDQVLLGALPVRHQPLRAAGMLRKVLVLDEVHACDPCMEETLGELLRQRASCGDSVILLTATLPARMRRQLVQDFLDGLKQEETESVPLRVGAALAHDPLPLSVVPGTEAPFPLLLRASNEGVATWETKHAAELEREVAVHWIEDEAQAHELLTQAARSGRCACWIRNTVGNVIRSGDELRCQLGPEAQVRVFHSRYPLLRRLQIEQEVLRSFGPESTAADRAGQVLIASQVVEQSLDIDFDLLITDLAPVDLILQRLGRLMRHARDAAGNRLGDGHEDQRPLPVLVVLGPRPEQAVCRDWATEIAGPYGDRGRLWLTARALLEHVDAGQPIAIPSSMRRLIEAVYGNETEPVPETLREGSRRSTEKARKERDTARNLTEAVRRTYGEVTVGWLSDQDERVRSRLEDMPSIDCLAAQLEGGRLAPLLLSTEDGAAEPASPRLSWQFNGFKVLAYRLARFVERNGLANYKDLQPQFSLQTDAAARSCAYVQHRLVVVFESAEDGLWQARDRAGRTFLIYSPQTGITWADDGAEE